MTFGTVDEIPTITSHKYGCQKNQFITIQKEEKDVKEDQPKICKVSSPGVSPSDVERVDQVTTDAKEIKAASDEIDDIIIQHIDVDIDPEVDDQRGNDAISINICGVEAEKEAASNKNSSADDELFHISLNGENDFVDTGKRKVVDHKIVDQDCQIYTKEISVAIAAKSSKDETDHIFLNLIN